MDSDHTYTGLNWIDTHCHLDAAEFDPDRDTVVSAAYQAGVRQIVVPAVEAANFRAVTACVERYAPSGVCCYPAYGIHPLYTLRANERDLGDLADCLRRAMAGENPPLALGEIGLDGFVPGLDMARQESFFAAQLKIARDFDLPVLLHIRRAQDRVLKHLRQVFGKKRGARPAGIAHAFNGSRQQAEAFIELGFKLGFGGAATYPRATRLREHLSSLPIESIVLETDAPDIAPVFAVDENNRPARNEPALLGRIAPLLAGVRGMPVDDFCRQVRINSEDVLPGLVAAGS